MPKQNRSKLIYDSILTAARKLYEEIGFDASTTNKIADKAGVGIGSLYRYFPDKNSILKKLTEKFIEANNEIFISNMNKLSVLPMEKAVENIVDISVEHFLQQKAFFVIFLIRAYEVGLEGEIYRCRQTLSQDFTEILLKNYPHQIQIPREQLEASLYLSFHSYMSTLLAYMQLPRDKQNLEILKQNLTALFLGVLQRSSSH